MSATSGRSWREFCLNCHSTAKQKGDLDLERFASLKDIRRDTKVWLKVAEMLDNGEMPPKEAKQPTSAERRQLRGWVESYLHAESLAQAGDPGPVVLRRLSNAEYTYTIRDLTGVDLNPARDFPTDGAAGEGFTNTGNALVMSPALLTKYFDAGREIAQHAVLLPDGFRFSPSISRADWTNDVLAQIRAIYRKYSDNAGASQVNLQGIIFNTNDGGRLPIERYVAATFDVAERLSVINTRTRASQVTNQGATPTALRGRANPLDVRSTPTQSRGRGTQPWDHKSSDINDAIAAVAAKDGLNAKYLGILWDTLTDREPSLLLDEIRAHWRAGRPADAPQIAAEIGQWQKAVWRFSSVGHIGKVGGPKAWQEPVTPITASQELRIKLPTAAAGQKDVTLYLVASDAGDGNATRFRDLARAAFGRPGPAGTCCSATWATSHAKCRHGGSKPSRRRPGRSPRRPSATRDGKDRRRRPGEDARSRRRFAHRLVRLPGHRSDCGDQARLPREQGDQRVKLRFHPGLEHERAAATAGQFVQPARPRSRQHEAALGLRASVADAVRSRRLAKPDRRLRSRFPAR